MDLYDSCMPLTIKANTILEERTCPISDLPFPSVQIPGRLFYFDESRPCKRHPPLHRPLYHPSLRTTLSFVVSTMNIRPARVSLHIILTGSLRCLSVLSKIDDLMGMQACNLQNLPENYTMRYCTLKILSDTMRDN